MVNKMAADPQPTRPVPGGLWPHHLEETYSPVPCIVARTYNDLGDIPVGGVLLVVNAGQAVQFISTPTKIRTVICLAAATNAGTIFVGGRETGFPLAAGAAVTLHVKDLSTVWYAGTAANDVLYYLLEQFLE
jgi:hypothetical protein